MGKIIFFISAFSLILQISADHGPIPPPLWCDDPSLAEESGVSEQCKAYNTSGYGKKLQVTLLYESLCPDCQSFIKDTLYPQVWKYGRDFVNIELVPYGNARHKSTQNGTYEISCQHGAVECQLNKVHSCVIHQLVDTNRWLPFINCMEVAAAAGLEPAKATDHCYSQQKIKTSEKNKINQCINGSQGDQLQKAAADRTDAVTPEKHQFVPWILINDISLTTAQMYQGVLFDALCNWYRSKDTPVGCTEFMHAARQNKCTR